MNNFPDFNGTLDAHFDNEYEQHNCLLSPIPLWARELMGEVEYE